MNGRKGEKQIENRPFSQHLPNQAFKAANRQKKGKELSQGTNTPKPFLFFFFLPREKKGEKDDEGCLSFVGGWFGGGVRVHRG